MANHTTSWIAYLVLFCSFFINSNISQTNNFTAALLCLFFTLAFIITHKSSQILKTPALVILLPIILISISYITNPDTSYWMRYVATVSTLLFGAILYSWLSTEDTSILVVTLSSIISATFVYFMVWVIVWISLNDPFHHNWTWGTPMFRHIRHLGYMLVCSVITTTAFYLNSRNQWKTAFFLMVFTAACFLMFWNGGRGALLSLFPGLMILSLTHMAIKKWLILTIAATGAFLLSLFFQVNDKGLGLLSTLSKTVTANSLNSVTSGRLEIWLATTEKIMEKPWFGWGPDAFILLKIAPGFVQPHNGLLQLLLEGGFLFTAPIFLLISIIVYQGIKTLFLQKHQVNTEKELLILGLSLSTSLLTHSLSDGIFYHGSPLTMLSFSLSLTAACSWRLRNNTPTT